MLPSAEKSEGDGEEGSVSNWFNGIVDKVQDLEIHDKIGNGMDNMKRTVGSFHNSMRDAVADLPDVSMPSVPSPSRSSTSANLQNSCLKASVV